MTRAKHELPGEKGDLLRVTENALPTRMTIQVSFYSYFKDLTGCAQTTELLAAGMTVGDLTKQLIAHFPKLAPMRKSTLIAVGVEYQNQSYILKEGDEVSLFPPVQGG